MVSTGGATAWGGSQVRMAFADFTRQLTLTADGSVWTCGSGEDGLLGNSNLLDLGVPTRIDPTAFGHATMVFVTGNNRHSFAVTTEGILYSWGRDGVGVTAAAGPPPRATPMPVAASLAPGVRVGRSCRLPRLHTLAFCMGTHARVGAGAPHGAAPSELLDAVQSSAVHLDGNLRARGRGPAAPARGSRAPNLSARGRTRQIQSAQRPSTECSPGHLPPVCIYKHWHGASGDGGSMAVAVGFNYVVALTERGGLMIFGENDVGLLDNDAQEPYFDPVLVGGVAPEAQRAALDPAAPGEAVLMLRGGDLHVCCLTDSRAVWVWGTNEDGQLGLGDEENRLLPERWADGECGESPVVMVDCGFETTVALTAAKQVWACGYGSHGQNCSTTRDNLLVPTRVPGLDNIVMVGAQAALSVALAEDGVVWTWGGYHEWPDQDTPAPVAAPVRLGAALFGGSAVVFVAAGTHNWAAVTARGDLWVCGGGLAGPTGPGGLAPVLVGASAPAAWGGAQVLAVSCGHLHTMAITEEGAVWTWGAGRFGKLGHGDEEDHGVPTRIPQASFGGARMVLVCAPSYEMSTAVSEEGVLFTWGAGVLGNGGTGRTPALVPEAVEASRHDNAHVARSCRLPRQHSLAFGMGTHARLGAGALGRGTCRYGATPAELVQAVVEECAAPTGPYACMCKGLLRLLGVCERAC